MKVLLTYFKDSGKYYGSGELDFDHWRTFHDVVDHVGHLYVAGRLPGLIDGAGKAMYVLIRPPASHDDPDGVPHLLLPVCDVTCGRCGAMTARRRFANGVDVGVLCHACWKGVVDELDA